MSNWLKEGFSKLKNALFKTRKSLINQTPATVNKNIEINNEYFQTLHEHFIKADIGFDFTEKIILELKKQIKERQIDRKDLQDKIKGVIKSQINESSWRTGELASWGKGNSLLHVFLIAGVNGSGKTTSIGKLAKHFKDEGFKVLIVAADTFRAAAGEQLDIWAKRAEVEIYAPPEIKKPDAVVFSAIEKAKKENYNLLLIDTAGRLHSQTNLMDELKKINTVIEKNANDAKKEKLIVLDATIGQNAITQAELFSKACLLTGIILAKLDSSAKGGVVLNIMNKLSLPVKLIGTGEKIDDIVEFNLDEYLDGLLM